MMRYIGIFNPPNTRQPKSTPNSSSKLNPRDYAYLGLNEGWTPLHFACLYGQVKQVHKLVYNPNPKVINAETFEEGYTPLQLACHSGKIEIVTALINAGARINNKLASTPLRIALENNYIDIVQALIMAGANIFPQDLFYYDDNECKITLFSLQDHLNKQPQEIKNALAIARLNYHINQIDSIAIRSAIVYIEHGRPFEKEMLDILSDNENVIKTLRMFVPYLMSDYEQTNTNDNRIAI